MVFVSWNKADTKKHDTVKPVNTDTEGGIKSVGIKRVKFKEKGFLSPGTKQTVRNNEVSVLSGCP